MPLTDDVARKLEGYVRFGLEGPSISLPRGMGRAVQRQHGPSGSSPDNRVRLKELPGPAPYSEDQG
jgi:hypothetical protein